MPELDRTPPPKRPRPFPLKAGDLATILRGTIPYRITEIAGGIAYMRAANGARVTARVDDCHRYHGTRAVP